MGGARAYNPAGGFYFKDFEQVGDTIYYKGLVGKILRKVDGSSSGLPSRSGKSDFLRRFIQISESVRKVPPVTLYWQKICKENVN